jgi:hypothetical protein
VLQGCGSGGWLQLTGVFWFIQLSTAAQAVFGAYVTESSFIRGNEWSVSKSELRVEQKQSATLSENTVGQSSPQPVKWIRGIIQGSHCIDSNSATDHIPFELYVKNKHPHERFSPVINYTVTMAEILVLSHPPSVQSVDRCCAVGPFLTQVRRTNSAHCMASINILNYIDIATRPPAEDRIYEPTMVVPPKSLEKPTWTGGFKS